MAVKPGERFVRTTGHSVQNPSRPYRAQGYTSTVKTVTEGGIYDAGGVYHSIGNIKILTSTADRIAEVEAEIYDAEKRLAELYAEAKKEERAKKLAEYSVGKKVQHHRTGLIYEIVYHNDDEYVLSNDGLRVVESRFVFDDFAIVS